MNDRARALALLQEARQILIERLTERVLELGDDLLDDARGESFAGEIDQVYDQIGLRLSQVNSLLAALPPTELVAAASGHGPVSTVEVSAASHSLVDYVPYVEPSPPAAGESFSAARVGDDSVRLRTMVELLMAGEVETMDKKAKKRLDLLQNRLQKLRMQLAGAKKQLDEPAEVARLEREIAEATAELEKLKSGK